jgi:hypothetical protein
MQKLRFANNFGEDRCEGPYHYRRCGLAPFDIHKRILASSMATQEQIEAG